MFKPVDGFDWDQGNRIKCQKHGVSMAEIESLFDGSVTVFRDPAHSELEERLKIIGKTSIGRFVFVDVTLRVAGDVKLIRPISARYMHRHEVEYYEKIIAGSGE